MSLEAKQRLQQKFPEPPNFLDRIGLPDEDARLIDRAKDSIIESERFWLDVIEAYHDFLKGWFISSKDKLIKLIETTSSYELDKLKLLHLNLALVYFNLADEYRVKRAKEKENPRLIAGEKGYAIKAHEHLEVARGLRGDVKNELHIKVQLVSGFFFNWQGKYNDSINAFNEAFALAEETKDLDGVAKCYDGIGATYRNREEFDECLRYRNKALKIYEESGNADGILEIQHNIAFILWKQAPRDLKYLRKLIREILPKVRAHLEHKSRVGDQKVAVVVCESIAGMFDEIGETEEAKKYREKAEEIRREFQIM